jgi:hypothetical protein
MAQISPRLIKWDLEIRLPHIDSSEGTWMNKDMNEDFDGKVSPSSVKHVTNFHHNCHWLLVWIKFKKSISKNISQVLSLPSWIHHIITDSFNYCLLICWFNLKCPVGGSQLHTRAIPLNIGHIWCCRGLLQCFFKILCCPWYWVKEVVVRGMANFLCKWDANVCNGIFNADVAESIKICWEPN